MGKMNKNVKYKYIEKQLRKGICARDIVTKFEEKYPGETICLSTVYYAMRKLGYRYKTDKRGKGWRDPEDYILLLFNHDN